jgi:DedD protein
MAFFKFRNDGDDHPNSASAPESVEAMRQRAKHRLIGAAVLVLVGVVGFPLVFDNQPRPIPVDMPIDIPDKNTVKPADVATTRSAPGADAGKIVNEVMTPGVSNSASNGASVPAAVPPSRVVSVPAKPPEKSPEKPFEKPLENPVDKPRPVPPETNKAEQLLNGSASNGSASNGSASTPAAMSSKPGDVAGRFVVQIGAFADVSKAREARLKLESAGLKTYTQVVALKEGKRIRVRVGPFQSKAEADKAAAKIKKLDLPTAILEL